MEKDTVRGAAHISPQDWVRIALGVAVIGLVYYAYWVQLVGVQMSTYRWLITHWRRVSNY
jgi:hypothetical protein